MKLHLPLAAVLLGLASPQGVAAGPAPLAAQGCLGCHGPEGGGAGALPAIAGRDAGELRGLLNAFRAGERPATIMDRIARGYSEAELAAIVAHFAGRR
ncbi:MAG TPA: c-type cytochrome [Falsiroseomonas sp.]|jgi:cytochrome c553|nr:c-type cytochrome [Falsiroseomonas sp.]